MRRLLQSVFAVLALSAMVPATAVADGFAWNGSVVCGGNTFATCASVNVTTIYDAATHTTFVTMQVTNLSGTNGTFGGTVFTQMGLFNLPAGSQYAQTGFTAVDANGNPISGWQTGTNGLTGSGITRDVRGVDPINGIAGGLAAGGTYTFTFALTGLTGPLDMNSVGFAIHGQSGPSCSTKLVVTNGVANQGAGTCATVTPEPVSMTLLATGLTAVAGVGAIRRRRKQQTVA